MEVYFSQPMQWNHIPCNTPQTLNMGLRDLGSLALYVWQTGGLYLSYYQDNTWHWDYLCQVKEDHTGFHLFEVFKLK